MAKKDYYDILGVQKGASKDDIKKAFHKKAHQFHPDKNKGDDAHFKEVNEAYQTLSDDQKRAAYDQFGHAGANMGGAGFGGQGFGQGFGGFDFSQAQQQGFDMGDLGEIFSDFFGGRRQQEMRGRDISTELSVSFEEAVFGITRAVLLTRQGICDTCKGNGGKPGAKMEKCKVCNGKGAIHETRRSILGSFSTERVCDACMGAGEVPSELCATCKGKGVMRKQEEVQIKIPAGIDNGEMVRLRGMGEAIKAGQAGDLYVKIHVRPHKHFAREGNNLVTHISIKLSDSLLGAEYNLNTLDGDMVLNIPVGIKHGELLRVHGRGIPHGSKRGDLYVKISIDTPTKLSKKAKELVEELRREGV